MIVRRIALNGWRNYDFEAFDFSPNTNVIRGQNAQGKTNLLEAVYMLAAGRSFRSRFDRELVGFGFSFINNKLFSFVLVNDNAGIAHGFHVIIRMPYHNFLLGKPVTA